MIEILLCVRRHCVNPKQGREEKERNKRLPHAQTSEPKTFLKSKEKIEIKTKNNDVSGNIII